MKKLFKKILLSDWSFRILYIVLGISIGLVISAFYIKEHIDLIESLKILLTPSIVIISVFLASRSYIYTRDWNMKNAANFALKEFVSKFNAIIEELHPYINLRQNIRTKTPLEMYEIHNLMGVFVKNNDSYKFVYHGKHTQDDIKKSQQDESLYLNKFDDKVDGMKIERALISLLGEYEYISSAVKKEILDKDIIVELLSSNIINSYYVFLPYIYHLRLDNRHGDGTQSTLYENFENLAIEVEKLRNEKSKQKEFPYFNVSKKRITPKIENSEWKVPFS